MAGEALLKTPAIGGTAGGALIDRGVATPDIWSTKLNVKLYERTFLKEITNNDWENEASGPGDTVFIREMPDIPIRRYVPGQPMKRVSTTPAAGQYTVNPATGLYTFAVDDKGKGILVSYEYAIANSPGSETFMINNTLMGYTPSFSALFYNQFNGKTLVMKLNQSTLGKLALPFKNDDFTLTDLDAEAFADSAGQIGYISMY